MTTTNSNGKRNGRKTEETALSETIKTNEELEQLLENGKAALGQQHKGDTNVVLNAAEPQPTAAENQSSTNTVPSSSPPSEPTAEDLLRAAKKVTREQSGTPVEPERESSDEQKEGASTVTTFMDNIVGQSASDLVQTSQQAQVAVVAMAFQEGLNDVRSAEPAYQAGLLLGLAQIKARNVNDLAEQVSALRSHVNTANAEIVGKILGNLGIGQAKESIKLPLPMVRETPKLKII